jgi:hypothetical protein
MRRALAILLGALAPAAGVFGQEPAELITDRPDQTESAAVVPHGALQVELGALRLEDDDLDVTEVPGTLVRYGLHPRFELRFAWPGWIEAEARGARLDGAADPELGAKLAIFDERGARPDLALLAHLTLPAGDDAIGSPRADPSIRIAGAHTLSETLGLGWNLGYEAASFEDSAGRAHTLGRWIYTAALGFDLAPRWGAFVELFGDLPASDPAPAAHSLDGGVTYLVRPNVQLDLAAGVGLDADAPDRFVGIGLSFRLPR